MDDRIPVGNVSKCEDVLMITKYFQERYNVAPEFFIRVPGRVNLIGEHIDYCGYPVLPMALEQGVLLAVKPLNKPQIILKNQSLQYPEWSGDIDTSLHLREGASPQWYEYVLCGVKGAADAVRKLKKINSNEENKSNNEIPYTQDTNGHLQMKNINGFMAIVSGNVPAAAGLSSSSALVCAASLALIRSNQITMGKMEIAKLCASSERLIGTEGGGMDQAIAFLAESGSAQHISWNPLKAQSISLPEEAVFVVAHSLVEANKAASDHFNTRVRECKLAAKLIAEDAGLDIGEASLSEVHKLLGDDLEEMLARASRLPAILHQQKPRDRALHVFQEALRVQKFTQLCKTWNCNERLSSLGTLMRQSHESLRYLYECSHPALDRLVELSDEFGVFARLTGAGWGGCIVALCPQYKAESYVEMLKEKYYRQNMPSQNLDLEKLVFITKPHKGAEILINTDE